MDLRGYLAPDIAQVPRFELVATSVLGSGGIAEDEPILVGVGGDPLARRRVGERGTELTRLGVQDIERGAELVLAVTGTGAYAEAARASPTRAASSRKRPS